MEKDIRLYAFFVVLSTVLLYSKNPEAAITSLGCFNEPVGNRVFYTFAGTYNPNVLTPTTCTSACQLWGYRYAGMTQGTFCFCSNQLPSVAQSTSGYCNWPCPGNSALMCGGQNYVSVYEIDVPVRGLQLLITNPTSAMIAVDQSVQFNLSIVDGPRTINYNMNYGDRSVTTAWNDTTMYNHTFSMPGEFTITATGDDPVATKSSVVISVQLPAANITMWCPPIVAAGSQFICNATVSVGTYIQLTIDWGDGLIENFPIADAAWFATLPGIPQHGIQSDGSGLANGNYVVLQSSEFRQSGTLVRFEYYATTAGAVTFLVLAQSCSSNSYCYDSNDCPVTTCPNGQLSCTSGTFPSCVPSSTRYVNPPAQTYTILYSFPTSLIVGRNVFDVSSQQIPVAAGNVIGYVATAGRIATRPTQSGEVGDSKYTVALPGAGTPLPAGPTIMTVRTLLRAVASRATSVRLFHTFTNPRQYVIQAVAQNILLNNQTFTPQYTNVTMDVAIPINDSTIVVSPFLTTGKSEYISLKPVSGSNITFFWNFGDGTPIVNTSVPYIYHVYTQLGCYNINETAINIISYNASVPTPVCVQDALANLTINTTLSASTIQTNFLINLGAGSNYTCNLYPGDNSILTQTWQTLPLGKPTNWSYVYTTEASYFVNITCFNNVSMVSAVAVQIIAAPITNLRLVLNGSIVGTPFYVQYQIDKGSSPKFVLTFNGQVYNTTYDPTTLIGTTLNQFSNLPVGVYPVTIVGTNPFGTSTFSVNFTVESPIVAPKVSCTPLNAQSGDLVTCSSSVMSGTSVRVVVDFGDGSAPGTYQLGLAVPWPNGYVDKQQHAYALSGLYPLTVTISNSFDIFQYNFSVYVIGKIGNISLVSNNPVPMIDNVGLVKLWFIAQIPPVNVTLVWNFGDGSPLVPDVFNVSKVYTRQYLKSGVYTITANISNSISSLPLTATIMIAVPVVNMQWKMPVAHASVNQSFIAGISMDVGNNVNLYWDFGDGSPSAIISRARQGVLATDIDNATHVYTQLGTYVITGIAMNAIGNTTIQYVVVVQIPVTNAFIIQSSAPVVFPPGTIDFTLTLPAGVPIPSLASMTWDWGDGTVTGPVPLPFNSSVNVFKISYTFASPGPYVLNLTINNLATTLSWPISAGAYTPISALSMVPMYQPPLPLNAVAVRGSGSQQNIFPLPFNVSCVLTFTGTPILYFVKATASPGGQVIASFNASSPPIGVNLMTEGSYNVEVTVWNPLSRANATALVIAAKSVYKVSVSGSPLVDAVNKPRYFTISWETVGRYSCLQVDYGDGSPKEYYSNSSNNANCAGKVNGPLPLDAKSITVSHVYTINNSPFTVTVTANDTIGFCAPPATYSVNECRAQATITVSSSNCAVPTVKILYQSTDFRTPYIAYRSQPLTLTADITMTCAETLVNYKTWSCRSLDPNSGLPVSSITNLTSLPSSNSSVLLIPINFLYYGLYEFTLNVSMGNSGYFVTLTSTIVSISHSLIMAYIGPPAMQAIVRGWNTNITLTPGNFSYDPDVGQPPLAQGFTNFLWFCREIDEVFPTNRDGSLSTANPQTPYTDQQLSTMWANASQGGCFRQGPGMIANTGKGSLTFSGRNMLLNGSYVFRVIVVKGKRNSTAELTVKAVPGFPPNLVIGCLDPLLCFPMVGMTKVNPTNRLTLFASCANDGSTNCDPNQLTYQWTISRLGLNEAWLPLPSCEQYSLGCRSKQIAVSTSLFSDGLTVYRGVTNWQFGLVATAPDGSQATAFIHIVVNSPPSGGSCTVTPATGTSTQTQFLISCSGWADEDGVTKYQFSSIMGDGTTVQLGSSVSGTLGPVALPVGVTSDYKYTIAVNIFDKLGAFAVYSIPTQVQVNPISEAAITAQISQLLSTSTTANPLQMALAAGNTQATVSLVQSLSSGLNQATQYADQKQAKLDATGNVTPESEAAAAVAQNDRSLLREQMTKAIATATFSSVDTVQLCASALASVTQATSEVNRNTQAVAVTAAANMVNALATMSSTTPLEQINIAAQSITTAIGNLLAGMNAGIVGTGTLGDIMLAADPKSADYFYDTSFDGSGSSFPGMSAEDQMKQLKEETNQLVQKKKAAQTVRQAFGVMNSLSDVILPRVVAGEKPLVFDSPSMSMTIAKDLPSNLFDKPLVSGSAEAALPTDFCAIAPPDVNCSVAAPIAAKMMSTPTNVFTFYSDADKVARGSTTLSLDLYDESGHPLVVNNTKSPIITFMPQRDGESAVATLTNVTMSTEDDRVDLAYFTLNVATKGAALVIEIEPDDPSVQLLVVVRYKQYPALNDSDTIKRGWDYLALSPSSLANINKVVASGVNPYTVIVDSSIVNDRVGKWYIGIRQLSVAEQDQYSMSNPPPVPQPFTGRLTCNFTLLMYTSGCHFTQPTASTSWQNYGCKVGPKTKANRTQCYCNHLTTFGGGFVVQPNALDFAFIFSHASFEQNQTLYIFEIVTCAVYIILFIYCRYMDKKDLVKAGITPLADNNPQDTYLYEVEVMTGLRKNAGTDSKVQFILSGDDDETDVRTFEDSQRKIFRRGATDSFLMSCPGPLGPLNYIRLWHDNSGKGKWAGWYVNYVMVRDIQTQNKYFFIINQWLAVEEEDGQISRLIPVSGRDQMASTEHLFSTKGKKGLRDDHIWYSVFARPVTSRFTRVQRLSCCLCIMFTAMLANALFYGQATDTAPPVTIGPLAISLQQVYVAVICNLITFPMNFIIAFLFKRARRRNNKSRIGEAVKKMLNVSSDVQVTKSATRDPFAHGAAAAGDDSWGAQRYVDPLTPEVRPTTAQNIELRQKEEQLLAEKKKKKIFMLPWWVSIIAWILLWITVGVSVAFVTFYGIMFQDIKCKKWLSSILLSFFQSVLLTQPIKVLLFALLFAMICKKPVDDDVDEGDVDCQEFDLQRDELWLHAPPPSTMARPARRKRYYEPPDPVALKEAREYRLKQLKMYDVIREVCLYSIFVIVTITVCYDLRDANTYLVKTNLKNTFIDGYAGAAANSSNSLAMIQTMNDFWSWMNNTAVPGLRADNWYNLYRPVGLRGFLSDRTSRLIGFPTLRQVRIKRGKCTVPSVMQGVVKSCTGSYSYFNADTDNYTAGWKPLPPPVGNETVTGPPEYSYTPGSALNSYPYYGSITVYNGGGYVAQLSGSLADIQNKVGYLQRTGWIDKWTRAIFLEFTIYNANVNLFACVTLIAELMESGGFTYYYRIEPMNLLASQSMARYIMYGLQAIFAFYIVIYLIKEARSFWKDRRRYFTYFWSWVDIQIIAISLGSLAIYVLRIKEVNNLLTVFETSGGNAYTNFQSMAYWSEMLLYMLGLVLFWATIKFIKLLRFNKMMSLLGSTLTHASEYLLSFCIIFSILFFAFVQYFYQTYFADFETFSTIVLTSEECLQMLVGKFNFSEINSGSQMGVIMFLLYMVVVFFCLLTMFITIVNEAFAAVCDDLSKQNSDYEIVDFIVDKFRRWFGVKVKNKILRRKTAPVDDPTPEATLLPFGQTPNTADVIDNFPERMERFLNCISQVYFQQDSFNAIFTNMDKTGTKNMFEDEMSRMKKKAVASGSHDQLGVDG